MNEQWQNSRAIIERVIVRGTLVLTTPAQIGNGDAAGLTDVPLLRDPLANKPLLTGTAIAGALRNYLRERERGYRKPENQDGATRAEKLFGHLVRHTATIASWLIVEDALGEQSGVELRDGVALDPKSRTARDKTKFDHTLFAAGTTFELEFELLLTAKNADLLESFVLALGGFEQGEISLGSRKRRGLGACRVNAWRVWRYKMTTPQGLLGWLTHDPQVGGQTASKLSEIFGDIAPQLDARNAMTMRVTCALDAPMLIRAGADETTTADLQHLHSARNGKSVPILSGTSIAGAIRARAFRITNTLLDSTRAQNLVDGLFGKQIARHNDKPTGSRVIVREVEIANALTPERIQSRVKIDRFTGGAYPGALFSEQPALGAATTRVTLDLAVQNPQPAEIGLFLLLLKDIWSGDLTFGGERGVGRGSLAGESAILQYAGVTWTLTRAGDAIKTERDPASTTNGYVELESYVNVLKEAR